jgi:hypothetical protein
MHHRHSRAHAVAAVLVVLFVASAGRAEPPKTAASPSPSGYTYQFIDDPLAAGGFGAHDARILVASHVIRTTLIRPRTAFIVEMLKTVENL